MKTVYLGTAANHQALLFELWSGQTGEIRLVKQSNSGCLAGRLVMASGYKAIYLWSSADLPLAETSEAEEEKPRFSCI
jgi:hypothetical protein